MRSRRRDVLQTALPKVWMFDVLSARANYPLRIWDTGLNAEGFWFLVGPASYSSILDPRRSAFGVGLVTLAEAESPDAKSLAAVIDERVAETVDGWLQGCYPNMRPEKVYIP